jgi:hypothetical protein
LEQGDVFEYTTPVNGRRVQTMIMYDANHKHVMSSPGTSGSEAMVFEMRLDNGPWLPIVDPVMGIPLGATGPAQLEENIFKHLGLAIPIPPQVRGTDSTSSEASPTRGF